MKKFLFLLVGLLFAAVLSGCNSTIIKEFDKDTGKQIRETQTNLTDLTAFTKNLENKSVFLWRSGWVAYIEGAPASQQNLSAHGVAWCGNVDEGWFFVCKDQQNVKDIASVVVSVHSRCNHKITLKIRRD